MGYFGLFRPIKASTFETLLWNRVTFQSFLEDQLRVEFRFGPLSIFRGLWSEVKLLLCNDVTSEIVHVWFFFLWLAFMAPFVLGCSWVHSLLSSSVYSSFFFFFKVETQTCWAWGRCQTFFFLLLLLPRERLLRFLTSRCQKLFRRIHLVRVGQRGRGYKRAVTLNCNPI